jgi:hypothetical protein
MRAECVGKATDAGRNGRKSVGICDVFSWNPFLEFTYEASKVVERQGRRERVTFLTALS